MSYKKSKEMTPLKALETIILGTNIDPNMSSIEEIDDAIGIVQDALKCYEMERTLRIRLENINHALVEENKDLKKFIKEITK